MTDPWRYLKGIDWSADTIKVSLHTGPVAPVAPVYPDAPIQWHDGGEVTVTGALVYDSSPGPDEALDADHDPVEDTDADDPEVCATCGHPVMERHGVWYHVDTGATRWVDLA